MKRFWSKVEKTSGCWNWTGATAGAGYGVFRLSNPRRMMYAHRFAFLRHNGYLPKVVRHSCDNPRCVNHDHLLPGTQADNVRDMIERRGPNRAGCKLTDEQVAEIRIRLAAGEAHTEIAADYPITRPTISMIASGKIWKQ